MDGVLNIYKEQGFTSHDVVAKLRRILGQKRIGHTGTLDPMAEGVLPVCIGSATRLCDTFTDATKEYEAVLLLGEETDTQDVTGTVVRRAEKDALAALSEESVKSCMESFIGEYDQLPPMYSAVKVGGKKLYELARAGKEVDRKSRRVRILELRILSMELPRVSFLVSCSKGTYIRTLCSDIGERLLVGGTLESLIRTRSGNFVREEARTLSEIEGLSERGELFKVLIPVEQFFSEHRKLEISQIRKEDRELFERLVRNGNAVPERIAGNSFSDGELVRVYEPGGRFAGVYRYSKKNSCLEAYKMFPCSD
ncbi:MAG: tRNA pseudouridine(55) synthase TruB [Lachnospiraceae bacterium]|nr:tRNA pseudouridine(55) synthase TruB [Lachnospiraceae bacterium]